MEILIWHGTATKTKSNNLLSGFVIRPITVDHRKQVEHESPKSSMKSNFKHQMTIKSPIQKQRKPLIHT